MENLTCKTEWHTGRQSKKILSWHRTAAQNEKEKSEKRKTIQFTIFPFHSHRLAPHRFRGYFVLLLRCELPFK